MNTPLVSIVVPVYNSEAYFEATLLSLMQQTYTNTKIILVNDGCTDTTTVLFKVHSDSLSHNTTISDTQYHDLRKYPLWIANFAQKHGYGETLKKELAFLLIRVTFESFAKNRFESTTKDIKNVIRILREFPDLRTELSTSERKIVDTYRISTLLGRLNVYRYSKQGKI